MFQERNFIEPETIVTKIYKTPGISNKLDAETNWDGDKNRYRGDGYDKIHFVIVWNYYICHG